MRSALRFLLLMLHPGLALANSPSEYCSPLSQVMAQAPFCEENSNFVSAASACLEKVDGEVVALQQVLSATFAARARESAEAQNSKFQNLDGNLENTSSSLAAILADAEKARGELLMYLEMLRYPGDPMPALMRQRGLAGYLAAFPCYYDRREALVSRIESLDKRIADLRRTRSADLVQLRKSSHDLDQLGGNRRAPAEVLGHSIGVGGGAYQGNRPGAGGSAITGEIQDPKLP